MLNDHWPDMAELGFLSNRLFDAVASGARVITDEVAGLRTVFGDSVQVARTPGELVDLVTAPDLDAVFGDDEQRRKQAQLIAERHSFAARAKVLLEDALRIRSQSRPALTEPHALFAQADGSDGGAEGAGGCLDVDPLPGQETAEREHPVARGGHVLGDGLRGRGLLLLRTLGGTGELDEARRLITAGAELLLLTTYDAQLGEQPPLDRHHGGQADDHDHQHQHQQRRRAEEPAHERPEDTDDQRRREGDGSQPYQSLAATPGLHRPLVLGRGAASWAGASCPDRPRRAGPADPRGASQRVDCLRHLGRRGGGDLIRRLDVQQDPVVVRHDLGDRDGRVGGQGALDGAQLVQVSGKTDDHSGSLAAGAVW